MSRVMRLKEKEVELINFIRSIERKDLLKALKTLKDSLVLEDKLPIELKKIIDILEDTKDLDLSKLIELKFLTEEQAEFLINCMKENKNIIITGDISTGKTTLMKALLKYYKEPMIICNENQPKNISMYDIAFLNKADSNTRVALGDIYEYSEYLTLLQILNLGSSVIAIAYNLSGSDWRKKIIDMFKTNAKIEKYAKNTLDQHKFIQVNTCRKDGNLIVDKITEI